MKQEFSNSRLGFIQPEKRMHLYELLFVFIVFFPVGIELNSGEFLFIQMVAPILVLIYFAKLILNDDYLYIPNIPFYYSAIIILFLWAIISWIKYPVFGTSVAGDTSGEVGLKSYFKIITGISVFFITHWYVYYHSRIHIVTIAHVLVWISLILGILRILSYFFSFDIPLFYGVFRYNIGAVEDVGAITYRLSGLDLVAYVGIFSLLAIRNSGVNFKLTLPLLSIFLLFMFLNAGRASTYGIILALLYYIVFIEKADFKKFAAFIILIIVFFSIIQFLPHEIFKGQLNRILAIEGGIQGQYAHRRGVVFKEFTEDFLEYPLFGRGIRPVSIGRQDRNAIFIEHQLTAGGHGTYHSLIGIFGVGGIYFILIFLFLPIIQMHFLRQKLNGALNGLLVFLLLNLVYRTLFYYASGKGYADYSLYFLTGVFCAIYAKQIYLIKSH